MFSQKSKPNETSSNAVPAAVSGKSITVQRKLTVGAVNDPLEHEADAVADKVMRMPEQNFVQRKCADCEKEEKLHRKPISESIMPIVQAKGEGNATVNNATANAIHSTKGNGSTLDANTQSFMSSRIGADFSSVKIHTDSEAIQMNRELNAKAFTTGNDIYFNEGQYQPGSSSGKQLLAHELTHVVQQGGKSNNQLQRKIQVNPGLKLDTQGFSTSKTGDVYTCPAVVKAGLWNEIFTSLLHSPRVFKVAGSTDAEVSKNFMKHMEARYNVVEFASNKKYKFPVGSSGIRMNPAYWENDVTGWHEKTGVERKTAVNDLNVHPDEYVIACNRATVLTLEGGSKSSVRIMDNSVASNDWIPGEAGYIENTKFSSASSFGTEGENIIYTGKDLFWGHFGPGNTYKSLIDWFTDVKSWDGEAVIKTHRLRTDVGLE